MSRKIDFISATRKQTELCIKEYGKLKARNVVLLQQTTELETNTKAMNRLHDEIIRLNDFLKFEQVEPVKFESEPKLGDRKIIDGIPCIYVKAGENIIVRDVTETADLPVETIKEIQKDIESKHLNIHTPASDSEDRNYIVTIGKQVGTGLTLKGAVEDALSNYNDKIPDFLSKKEREMIAGILDPK